MFKKTAIVLTVACAVAVAVSLPDWRPEPTATPPGAATVGPVAPRSEPPGLLPSRKQDGGPDLRRAYELARLADPRTGSIPVDIHRREQEFAAALPAWRRGALLEAPGRSRAAEKIAGWTFRGPWNIGGRTRALAFDVSDPAYQTLLAGGISGGMWRSIDDGITWTMTTGSSQLHSVTTVVQNTRPGSQNVWYYGTGEYRGNSAGGGGAPYRGDGVFKSLDSGATWSLLPSTAGGDPESFSDNWQYVWRLAVDPTNPTQDEVYAATYEFIQRSVDGGATWTSVLGTSSPSSAFTDVVVSSTGVVYASLSSSGGQPGIYRSTDGVTWADITPAGLTSYGRIVMALAPSDENIMYVFVADINGTGGEGFYKYMYLYGDGSGAAGFWWDRSAQMASVPGPGGNGPMETYGGYCQMVTVHPADSETVYIGGVHLIRSTDGFATNSNDAWVGGWTYTNQHADQHWMVFQPGSLTVAYTASDGGVHRTGDATATSIAWLSLNHGYRTSQFYTAAIDENLPGSDVLVGGMQDNGSWFTKQVSPTAAWVEALGGDGSFCAVADASSVIGTYIFSVQNGVVYRVDLNNNTGQLNDWTRIDPIGGGSYMFINPLVIDPSATQMLYVGSSQGVWRNSDYTVIPSFSGDATSVNWTHLTAVPSGYPVTAMAMTRAGARTLYYAGSNGTLYRLDDADTAPGGAVPTQLYLGPDFPAGGFISFIAIDPANDARLLLAVSNYNVNSLFLSEDGGASWTDVEGNLAGADGPSVRTVAIVPYGGVDVFFAGTSTGLYSTFIMDGAETVWQLEAPDEMGNVVVDYLVTRPADGLVVAATHGKGVYSVEIPAGTSAPEPGLPAARVLAQNVPNPFNPRTDISFRLDRAGSVRLEIFDIGGRRLTTLLERSLAAGDHTVSWDGTDGLGRAAAAGIYLYRLRARGVDETRRMTLVR